MPIAVFMKALPQLKPAKDPGHMRALSLTVICMHAWAACTLKSLGVSGLVGKESSGDLLVVNMMGAQPFETCSTACSGHRS